MTARRAVTVAGIALVGVLALATLVIGGLRIAHAGVLPGVSVEGVALGGASEEEAAQRLRDVVTARESSVTTFAFEDRTFELAPSDVGYEVDLEATVELAREPGRDGGLLRTSWAHVAALWRDIDLEPVTRLDDSKLSAWVDTVASEVDAEPFPGSVTVDPTSLEVSTRPPGPGVRVDQEALTGLVRRSLDAAGPETVELPTESIAARIEPEEVEALADVARRAVAEPLTLTAQGASVTLQPAELARMISLREVAQGSGDEARWDVELGVPVDVVEDVFAETAERFQVDPVDASFDVPRAPPVTHDDKDDTSWTARPVEVPVVPSKNGRTFDPQLAATQISEVLSAGQREAELRLRVLEPEFTTEHARAMGINQLIGTFTTYHACCAARVANIQRLADMVDGTVVEPGEQFSVNQISGERTCSKGFRPAGMILNGELVDACGGGVSQFGTTTFNAAFFAGLPIDAYKAHSWYISRYPMGREATLNYPSPDIDVRWTNDTGRGILVKTSYTGTSITVSLYGNNGGLTVEAVHGSPHNYRGYSTRYREDKSLPPGASRRIQSGAQGFDVTVVRVIKDGGEEIDREQFFTRYTPITEIVARNTSPAPPPPPPDSGGGDGGDGGGGGDTGGDTGGGDSGGEEPPADGGQ